MGASSCCIDIGDSTAVKLGEFATESEGVLSETSTWTSGCMEAWSCANGDLDVAVVPELLLSGTR